MAKVRVGRPTEYNDDIANQICDIVSNTPKMLEEICDENPHLPDAVTVYRWRIRHPEFGQKYAIAKQCQIEPLVSTILFKARQKHRDLVDLGDKISVNTAAIKRLQIEVDAIKWFAAKLAPKLYGDKKESDTGEKTASLIQAVIDKL